MKNDQDKERIEEIKRMIIELASGNFSYRIKENGIDDDLGTIRSLLSMTAEEHKSKFNKGFLSETSVEEDITQFSFILSENFKIEGFSASAEKILLFGKKEILGKKFENLLIGKSKKKWLEFTSSIRYKDISQEIIKLELKCKNSLIVPVTCSLSNFKVRESIKKFCLSGFTQFSNTSAIEQIHKNELKSKREKTFRNVLKTEADIRKIKNAHQYVLENLDQDLFSLKYLALHVGTNEFKLKYGFKSLYHITIFRFQAEKRLQKAALLIKNIEISLKEISTITGFKSYPHFSKSFKKRFGITPSLLKRHHRQN